MSRTARHDAYDAVRAQIEGLMDALREFHDGAEEFRRETGEALALVGHARRYMEKPGERLYCNWSGCLRDPMPGEFGIRADGTRWAPDREARALGPGEGTPYFKGRVHEECRDEIERRRSVD